MDSYVFTGNITLICSYVYLFVLKKYFKHVRMAVILIENKIYFTGNPMTVKCWKTIPSKQAKEKTNPIHFKSPEVRELGVGTTVPLSFHLNITGVLLSFANTHFVFEKQKSLAAFET